MEEKKLSPELLEELRILKEDDARLELRYYMSSKEHKSANEIRKEMSDIDKGIFKTKVGQLYSKALDSSAAELSAM